MLSQFQFYGWGCKRVDSLTKLGCEKNSARTTAGDALRDPKTHHKLITDSTIQCVSCKGPKNFITNPSQSMGLKTTGTVHICWPLFRTTGFTLWSGRGPLPPQHCILLALPMGKGQIFLFSKCHFQTFPYTIPCQWVHPSIRNLLLLSCV